MQQQERAGRGPVARHVQEMQLDFAEPQLVLRKGVEPRLLCAPIEIALPIRDKATHVVEIGAVCPGLARSLIGEAGMPQALAQIGDRGVVDRQSEGLWLWRHGPLRAMMGRRTLTLAALVENDAVDATQIAVPFGVTHAAAHD